MNKLNLQIVLITIVLAMIPKVYASYEHEQHLINIIIMCDQQEKNMDLLPTVLKTKGWVDITNDVSNNQIHFFEHLYEKKICNETYQIGFSFGKAASSCVVRVLGIHAFSGHIIEDLFEHFKPKENQFLLCRNYNSACPDKIVEWKTKNGSYYKYFQIFHPETKSFNVSVSFDKLKLKSDKNFSLCLGKYW